MTYGLKIVSAVFTCYVENDAATTWMLVQQIGNIVNFATNDQPAAFRSIVASYIGG